MEAERLFGSAELGEHLAALARRPDGPLGELTRERYPELPAALLEALGACADPEQAARTLRAFFGRFATSDPYVAALAENEHALTRLVTVFGASRFVGDAVVARPELADVLLFGGGAVSDPRAAVAAELTSQREALSDPSEEQDEQQAFVTALRLAKRRVMVEVAIADLAGAISTRQATRLLSDLADEIVQQATLRRWAATRRARSDRDGQARRARDRLRLGPRRHLRVPEGRRAGRRRRDQPLRAPSATHHPPDVRGGGGRSWLRARHAPPPVRLAGHARHVPAGIRALPRRPAKRRGGRRAEPHLVGRALGAAGALARSLLRRRSGARARGAGRRRDGRLRGRPSARRRDAPPATAHGAGARARTARPPGSQDGLRAAYWTSSSPSSGCRCAMARTPPCARRTRATRSKPCTRAYLERSESEALREGYGFLRRLEQRIHVLTGTSSSTIDVNTRGMAQLARRMGFADEPERTSVEQLLARYEYVTDSVRKAYLEALGL